MEIFIHSMHFLKSCHSFMLLLIFLLAKSVFTPSGAMEMTKEAIDFKTLRCLICRVVVEEIHYGIQATDPKRQIEVGYKSDGSGDKKTIAYARSEIHLETLTEEICDKLEDYVKVRSKIDDSPNVIRLVTPDGKMNPDFGMYTVVEPDDNLNAELKSNCHEVMEEIEESLVEISADEANDSIAKDEICSHRHQICATKLLTPDEL